MELIKVPVRIYMHLTMLNHWAELVEYVLAKASESRLLAECEAFYIGALGDSAQLPKLKEIVARYPKVEIRGHDENKMLYEFYTLRFLKQDADNLPKFYSVYLHSKSVTFPKEGIPEIEGRTPAAHRYDFMWFQYMIYWMVEKWQKSYRALDMKEIGYDTSGVRMIPLRMSAAEVSHASGNMWWANSEYVKTLSAKDLEAADWKDIFLAERWLWYKQPLTYIPCNMFTVGFPLDVDFHEYMNSFPNLEDYTSP